MNYLYVLKLVAIIYLLLIFALYIFNIINYGLAWKLIIPGIILGIFIFKKTKVQNH